MPAVDHGGRAGDAAVCARDGRDLREIVSAAALACRSVLPAADVARLRAFVAQGGSIETLQPLLPTCVLVAPETFHAWQPGCDLDASLASKTVQDSQAVSAADRAGLREGDRLRGCSIRFNDPDTPVERHIENREAPIQFLPRGASTRIMQWPATDAACPLLAP